MTRPPRDLLHLTTSFPNGRSSVLIGAKALAASRTARLPRSYWDWQPMIEVNPTGYFPFTPATNLIYGLHEAIGMLLAEGLDNVFARHERFGEATRRAVRAWGLEILCADESEYRQALTAVLMHDGHGDRKSGVEGKRVVE